MHNDARDRRGSQSGQRRRTVGDTDTVERVADEAAELIAIQRFRRRQRKERMRQQAFDRLFIDDTACRRPAVGVERRTGMQPQKIVEQSVAGSGVAGNQFVTVNVCDVRHAAEIEHRDRRRTPQLPHERAVKHRRQRRALPACRDIGGAKIVDHGNAEPRCQRAAIPDLQRQVPFRPVQQRLTVKTDDRHLAALQAVGHEEGFHRLGMGVVDQPFGLCDHVRPRGPVSQIGGRSGGAA